MTLYIVGFGCCSEGGMTLEARDIIESVDTVIGYTTYIGLMRQYFPDKQYLGTGMRQEIERVRLALETARERDCALVCSGDAELYGMASPALTLAGEYEGVEVRVVPGVTAALSGGALLGSPLTNDFAVISLSDLLTPWERIEKRLKCAAEGGFVIALYNPMSKSRPDSLARACGILLGVLPPETVCGWAKNIGREGEEHGTLTLGELVHFKADMFTTVFIGNGDTQLINGRMVTPRGYRV